MLSSELELVNNSTSMACVWMRKEMEKKSEKQRKVYPQNLTPSVLRNIYIFILLIICQFSTASEIQVGIKIVDSYHSFSDQHRPFLSVKSSNLTQNSR